jgi:hypothetical protein
MTDIIEPTTDYDFSSILLGQPTTLSGGSHFTRLLSAHKGIFVQTPKSLSKSGFIKSGKKTYIDLMFDDSDGDFVNWIANLETRCQELMFSKSDSWFER